MYPCLSGFPLSLSLLCLPPTPPCPLLSRNLCAIAIPPAAWKIALNVADRFSFIKRRSLKRMFPLVETRRANQTFVPRLPRDIISRSINRQSVRYSRACSFARPKTFSREFRGSERKEDTREIPRADPRGGRRLKRSAFPKTAEIQGKVFKCSLHGA